MSNFNALNIAAFESILTHEYSSNGVLMPFVNKKVNVVGTTVSFPFIGSKITTPYIGNQPVVGTTIFNTQKVANITGWIASDYIDQNQYTRTNVDIIPAVAIENGKAAKRRQDQLILDAFNIGATTDYVVGPNVGGTNSSLNVPKMMAAKKWFDDNSIPTDERYVAISADAEANFIQIPEIASNFYNTSRALADGGMGMKTWSHWRFVVIPSMAEGGLPLSSNIRTNYAFHGPAVGIGLAKDITFGQAILEQNNSVFLKSVFFMGAVVINPKGVLKIQTYEA